MKETPEIVRKAMQILERNQVTAALADEVFVGYAAPGSRTEALCRALAVTDKTRLTFDDRRTENVKALGFTTCHVE